MNVTDIKDPTFLKELSKKELKTLSAEIRSFLIEHIAKTGGHLASNLGMVELTVGLHYVFNSPKDSFIFDVSHQSYTHKILTGRAPLFPTLRKHKGLSGYASYKESIHDKWESGHAGTSISAMVGYLYANKLKKENNHVISIVGDASISNGTNMEALNHLGSDSSCKGIIILNDNKMSISKSVGSFSNMLSRLRGSKFHHGIRRVLDKILPNFLWRMFSQVNRGIKALFQRKNIFEDMGYAYIGPIDGNNITKVIKTLQLAKKMKKSVVVHVITQKGLGYSPAEQDIDGSYHGVAPFDIKTGKSISSGNQPTWSEAISYIIEQLEEVYDLFVVMPAMLVGAKFLRFQSKYPHKVMDVGIAEEHAAVMSASLALNDVNVFLPLYSTFSQRAYDQILNDIARPNIRVVIGIDRAGFVGDDGSTHQGLYDISMFLSMPNVKVTMPRNMNEAYGLLKYAYTQENPFVIRYPRGNTVLMDLTSPPIKESWDILTKGSHALIAYGPILDEMLELIHQNQLDITLINARYVHPIDEIILKDILQSNEKIIVYEQTHASGSLYQKILDYMNKNNAHNIVIPMNTYDQVINQGSVLENMQDAKLDMESLLKVLIEL